MMKNRIRNLAVKTVPIALLVTAMVCQPAMAAGWERTDTLDWRYEEDGGGYATGWRLINETWYYFDGEGIMETGWVKASEDGLWYCLDTETGAWVRSPVLDDTAVIRLMENEIQKTGYYASEDRELVVCVDSRQGSLIHVSLRAIDGPNNYTTLNNYRVHRKTGKVSADAGEDFELYH